MDGRYIVKLLDALGKIREVYVREMNEPHLHQRLRLLDEMRGDTVADTTGTAMEHHPHIVVFIQADLDEVIPRAERSKLFFSPGCSPIQELVILLFQNGLESTFQLLEANLVDFRRVVPQTAILRGIVCLPRVVRPCGTAFSIAERISARLSGKWSARILVRPPSSHTQVNSNSRGHDCAFRRDHAANGATFP